MKRQVEIVEWRDANFTFSDPDWEPEDDYVVASVGWTVEVNRWLIIVSEITPDGERAVTRVPIENVLSRKPLKLKKRKKSDSTSTT